MSNSYSNEDVQQILRQATTLEQENSISREQLQEIAAEVGISALHGAFVYGTDEKTAQLERISCFH